MAGCCCTSSSSHGLLHLRRNLLTSSTSPRPSATLRLRRAPIPRGSLAPFPRNRPRSMSPAATTAPRPTGGLASRSRCPRSRSGTGAWCAPGCVSMRRSRQSGPTAPPAPLALTPTPVVRRRGVAPAGRFRLFRRRADGGATAGAGPPPCASACARGAGGRGGNGAAQGVAAGVPVDVPAYFFFSSHMESFHLLNLLTHR
jgi:hypothetical protein